MWHEKTEINKLSFKKTAHYDSRMKSKKGTPYIIFDVKASRSLQPRCRCQSMELLNSE